LFNAVLEEASGGVALDDTGEGWKAYGGELGADFFSLFQLVKFDERGVNVVTEIEQAPEGGSSQRDKREHEQGVANENSAAEGHHVFWVKATSVELS